MRRTWLLVAAIVAAHPLTAFAQPADIPALTKVIDTQPADMDRSVWKEKRREAARKLAQSKDKRAVPVLIKLADTETFDIIGEIAIEGLGNLGDQSAVTVLRKISTDNARDKQTRELAKKALAKLGTSATGGGTTGGGTTGGGTTGGGATGGGAIGGGTGGGGTTGGGAIGGGTGGGKVGGGTTGGGVTGGGVTGAKIGGGTGGGTGGGKVGGGTTGGGTGGGVAGGGTGGGVTGGSTAGGGTTGGGATGGGAIGEDTGGGDTGELGGSGVVDANATVGGGNTLLGDPRASAEIPKGPPLPGDTIAAYDRMTLGAGVASFSYDTVRKRPAFDVDAAGRFEKRIERERMAWGVDAGAHVIGGFISPEGQAQTRSAQVIIDGRGEARFYSGKLYGVGKAAVGVDMVYASVKDADGNVLVKDTRTYMDFQVALGGGYGRVIDVGGAIRVRRLARTLDAARALGKQVDAATAKRLQLAWWALRGERSSYRALVATVAILREAGILLGEPDAGLTYELLNVLRDTQLYMRPSGMDVQVAFGEGYLVRPEMDPTPTESGRVEQLLVSAGYGEQLQDDKAEISGTAYARLRLFAPDTQPSPWAIGATGRFRKFAYGEHGDPIGAFDLGATVSLSTDSCVGVDCDSTTAARIEGQLGFSLWLNQASGVRLAATVAQDSGELFLGAQLEATYGLLEGTFAGF